MSESLAPLVRIHDQYYLEILDCGHRLYYNVPGPKPKLAYRRRCPLCPK